MEDIDENWREGGRETLRARVSLCDVTYKGLSYFYIMDIGSVRALVAFSWKVLAEGHLLIRRAWVVDVLYPLRSCIESTISVSRSPRKLFID